MSICQMKLLKLENIEKQDDKSYLNTVLVFDKDTKLLWEIDEYTAENIRAVTDFESTYKYRLSFNSYFNSAQEQYTGILNKTYRDQSEQISFSCSKDYIDKMSLIKNVQNINDINNLPFISKDSSEIHDNKKEIDSEKNIHQIKGYSARIMSVAILSTVFIALFSYLGCIYLDSSIFNEHTLAQSMQLDTSEVWAEEKIDSILLNKELSINAHSDKSPLSVIHLENELTYHISKGNVALTFDDGPSKYSVQIMDILKEHEVGGTFFFTGYNTKKYPEQIKYIHSNGYSIASHSLNHLKMSTLSQEEQEYELIESVKLIEEITNTKISMFRPPYGSFNDTTKELMNENDYKMVLWDIDPRDWESRNPDKIFDYIQNSDASGSIILLHESQAVIDALPRIIEYLKEQNLQIVNLQ